MLKNIFSKVGVYTISTCIFLSVFKPFYAQAISFSFYQKGFPNNGFLKGEFFGIDKNNDGVIHIDNYTSFYSADYDDEGDDADMFNKIAFHYSSDDYLYNGIDRIDISSDFERYIDFSYSISSNKLTGRIESTYYSLDIDQGERGIIKTCFRDELFGEEDCSNSPLVIQNLSDKNNTDNSSTKVPEGSLVTALATFSLAVFLKKNKKAYFK